MVKHIAAPSASSATHAAYATHCRQAWEPISVRDLMRKVVGTAASECAQWSAYIPPATKVRQSLF